MDDKCTIYRTADFIGKKWTILILLEIYKGEGAKRYSEIKANIPGITPKVLSARLKELAKEGLVGRKVDSSSFPIKCEYSLTKSGADFIRIIKDIKKWALKWKIMNKSCLDSDCSKCTL